VSALHAVSAQLAGLLDLERPDGAVLPVVLGDAARAAAARDACVAAGVRVGCFRPPSVPVGGSCLRLAARADLTADEVRSAAAVIRAAVAGAA
jgi:8-amino-7-oxononanoate synthase